jgi:RimJ/RimL family protein N-acetyltransferase
MDFVSLPPAIWLRGQVIGLRAPVRGDAGEVDTWYAGDPPLTPDEAEALLVAGERVPWGNNPVIRLMVVSLVEGTVVGGVVITRSQNRTSRIEITLGARVDEREEIQLEVLGLIVPWLLDELGLMTVKIQMPADDVALIAAAEHAGMRQAVRLREAIARPQGRVAD